MNSSCLLFYGGYTRGPEFDKIQSDNLLCCHYSVSLAESLGADVSKVKFPSFVKDPKLEGYKEYLKDLKGKIPEAPENYLALEPIRGDENPKQLEELHIKRCALVASAAGRTLIGFSGGAKAKDPLAELLETSRYSLNAGIEGRIAGRNCWGTEIKEALEQNKKLVEFMRKPEYDRELKEPRFTGKYD